MSMQMFFNLCIGIIILSFLPGCSSEKKSESFVRLPQLEGKAPQAIAKPYRAKYHGLTLSDDYHWLKDDGYPEINDKPVLDYIKAENDYYASFLAPHKKLVDTLFEEFKGRVNETDTSVPWQKQGYEYRWYYQPGKEYKIWVRRKLDNGTEQVIIDENLLAQGHEYFSLGDWDISPDNSYLAYSIDIDGSERSVIKIKNLTTQEYLEDELVDAGGSVLFSQNSQNLIYSLLQKDKWRTLSVNVHKLGTKQNQDKVLVTEDDEAFFLGFDLTSSEQYLILTTGDSDRTEVSVVSMADLNQAPKMLNTREQNFKLEVDHGNGYFYMLSNDTHVNFRIAKSKDNQIQYEQWQTVLAGSDTSYFKALQVFNDFIVIGQSIQGIESISILPNEGESHQ
ncbi:MAG: oligopeptidase B, partial [Gammaproteobacteria bacterium]